MISSSQISVHRIIWIHSRVSKGQAILDVGSADNAVWRGSSYDVVTCDMDPDEVHTGMPNDDPRLKPMVRARAEALPFEDNSFDVVSVCELLEHVTDPVQVLREALRVARKSVLLTVPNEWRWSKKLNPFGHPGHQRAFTHESLSSLISSTGCKAEVVQIDWTDWSWFGAEVFKQPLPQSFGDRPATPRLLYCTADCLGASTGAGIVTQNEIMAFQTLGDVAITSDATIRSETYNWDPFLIDAAAVLLGVPIITLWVFAPNLPLILCGGFLMQFMVQGAWGVIPAHINELSPDKLRGFFPSLAYQLGVLCAARSPYMEAVMAQHMGYAKAMGIFAVIVLLVGAVVISAGPEEHRAEFGREAETS